MATYRYVAVDNQGTTHKGVMSAHSEWDLKQSLKHQQLLPLEVQETEEKESGIHNWRSYLKFTPRTRLSARGLAMLTRQLASLVSADIPITDAIVAVAEQTEQANLRTLLLELIGDLQQGLSLAQTLGKYPKIFTSVYIAAISAGERTGNLSQVLTYLADYLERRQQMKMQLLQAILYPMIVTLVAVSVVTFLLINVVPQILDIYADTTQALPFATTLLLHCSHFVSHYGMLILAAVLILGLGLRIAWRNEVVRHVIQRFTFRLPLLGKFIRKNITTRLVRTLSLLLCAGIPALEALQLAARGVNQVVYRERFLTVIQSVQSGQSLSSALANQQLLPSMVMHLINSGERSGQLALGFTRAAEQQEQSLSQMLQTMLTVLEPVLILLMGLVVLWIVIAVLMPIFTLDQMSL